MRKIVPFKKEIIFKTNLSEITSIALEHTLQASEGNIISGEFIISGDYKMVETSVNVESFSFNIPFEVSIDDKYNIDNIVVDIYDFYYEIINNNVLSINIEVIIDGLEEKPITVEETIEAIDINEEIIEETDKEVELVEEKLEENNFNEEKLKTDDREGEDNMDNNRHDDVTSSLFDKFDSSTETYTTYKVYVVREGDTLDLLIKNYGVTKEELSVYNNVEILNVGDKLIIPAKKDEKNQ